MGKPLLIDGLTAEYISKGVFLMRERRQYLRSRGPFRGTWQSAFEHRQAAILDVNAGGCFVDGMGGPDRGEPVQVSITSQQRSVTLLGEVIYSDRVRGFAVAFADNPPERMEELLQLLDAAAAPPRL